MDSLLDPLRFAAGVYLLNPEQEAELDQIRARTEHSVEAYLVEASKYILRTIDPDELERTAALIHIGEISLPVLLFNPREEDKRKR